VKNGVWKWIAGAAVAAAAGGGYYAWQGRSTTPEYTYRTAKIERGSVIGRVTATGTLSAKITVTVGCQVSGRIASLYADYNSQVKKNQLIAKIDPLLYQAALENARANVLQEVGDLAKQRAALAGALVLLEREKKLNAEGLASQNDLDTAATAAETAKAQITYTLGNLEQARAQEHTAKINLDYTNIISPIDGTVISRSVDVGQTVAASLSAPTLFTIGEDLRKMQVDTNVTEGDVGRLKDNMAATFMVDAFPNKRFKGTILQIRNAATTVQNVVTYDAVIDVDNSTLELRPGMTANVTVVYDEKHDVIVVPNAALRFRPPGAPGPRHSGAASEASAAPSPSGSAGHHRHWRTAGSASAMASGAPAGSAPAMGSASPPDSASPPGSASAGPSREDVIAERKAVWVLRGAKPERVPVRTGLTDGTSTEIVDGDLQEGDQVVLEAISSDDSASTTAKPPTGGAPRMRL
jgi:HlyD family secretion protein